MLSKKNLPLDLAFAIESGNIERIRDVILNIKAEKYSLKELREISEQYKEYLENLKPGLLHESGLDIEEYKIVLKQTDSKDMEELIDILLGL